MAKAKNVGELLVCRNPKATQQYEIEERVEAGMVLTGSEVKSLRKRLMHRREIERWEGQLTRGGYTVVPLSVYFKSGHAKIELGLAKGRKKADRRQDIKREQDIKEARAAMTRDKAK